MFVHIFLDHAHRVSSVFLVGVQGNLQVPIRTDVPSYVDVAKKATGRGMYACRVFWILSPSPSRNPEVDNKQMEVRLLMSININKWTFLHKLRDNRCNRH